MFDWVLNTPLFLDGYFLHGDSGPYVNIVVPECFKNVVSRSHSFKGFLCFKFNVFFFCFCFCFFDAKYFYEMAICCVIVITSCINAVLYKLNAFIKKQCFMV